MIICVMDFKYDYWDSFNKILEYNYYILFFWWCDYVMVLFVREKSYIKVNFL